MIASSSEHDIEKPQMCKGFALTYVFCSGLKQILEALKGDAASDWDQLDEQALLSVEHSCFLCFAKKRMLQVI